MDTKDFKIITVNAANIDSEHICCAIGNDKTNAERAAVKKEWLKKEFQRGHVFKKVDIRGKAFIEYSPTESAWFPIIAPGYIFIQCFWTSGQYNGIGLGKSLIQECEQDSKETNGLVAVTSPKKKPFLSDKKFFVKNGFTVCDQTDNDFELVVKKFKPDAPNPQFTERAKKLEIEQRNGIVFYYTDMCPFVPAYVYEMEMAAQKLGIPSEIIKIETLEQAQNLPSPFGIFNVFYNGKFLTHELMPEKKFSKVLLTLNNG